MNPLIIVFLLLQSFEGAHAFFSSHQGTQQGRGELSLEYRKFLKDDSEPETKEEGLAVKSHLFHRYRGEKITGQFSGVARADSQDESRNTFLIEDFFIFYRSPMRPQLSFLAGYKLYNWSHFEIFNASDVVNSRNWDSSPDTFEKKGELSAELSFNHSTYGNFSFLYLPRFEAPLYPSRSNRLGLGFDLPRAAVYDDGEISSYWRPQFALHWKKYARSFETSFHYIDHIDRLSPIVGYATYARDPLSALPVPLPDDSPQTYFFRVRQAGVSFEKEFAEVLMKLEVTTRRFRSGEGILSLESLVNEVPELKIPAGHETLTIGANRTFGLPVGHDLTLFVEYTSLLGTTKEERREMALFQRDIAVGGRYFFNDINAKEISWFFIQDLDLSDELIWGLAYRQRAFEHWGVSFGLRWFHGKDGESTGSSLYRDDQFLFTELTRYF